jgi:CheY-like chemotaxis protein
MLRQSEKMKALGQLTGGIAHDFNNLLGVIIGSIEFLMDAVKDMPEQAELAREILDSALSGLLLTRRLLAVGRNQPLRPQRVDLSGLVQDNVEMLRRTLREAIHIEARPTPGLWFTSVDPSQIRDLLLNLALNSRDAMPHGGSLAIEVANVHLDAEAASGHPELAAGDYVALSVTDTGTGMPQEVAERAIEPFFTTKSPTAGSGLGLSMAYGFAKQSGGHLDIQSAVGVGTTVRLLLPRSVDETVDPPGDPAAFAPDPRGSETLLVVDDNQSLLDVTRRHLAALGYKVLTAPDGPSALAVLRAGESVDLLFTDIVMPKGMSGPVLAEATRDLRPDTKVLFTTGYTADALDQDGLPTLRKPYDRHELARAIRAALDGVVALPAMRKRL